MWYAIIALLLGVPLRIILALIAVAIVIRLVGFLFRGVVYGISFLWFLIPYTVRRVLGLVLFGIIAFYVIRFFVLVF